MEHPLRLLGYALGNQWQQVGQYSNYPNNAILVIFGLAVVALLVRRIRAPRLPGLADPITEKRRGGRSSG